MDLDLREVDVLGDVLDTAVSLAKKLKAAWNGAPVCKGCGNKIDTTVEWREVIQRGELDGEYHDGCQPPLEAVNLIYTVTTLSEPGGTVLGRRAVATIGDAKSATRQILRERLHKLSHPGIKRSLVDLNGVTKFHGGTVGPLADGAVIVIAPTTISDLADTFSSQEFNELVAVNASDQEWIDRYNARWEAKAGA